ncbi:protein cereblon-like [Metopolophium dirhodum]|uniref:protein cereblon-like n=1 Tax=Metopolophium dirhodum TaxID=44670 RepID=UPI0029901ACE|nr:protein cereblon-like [Metopolophium dirhodum]
MNTQNTPNNFNNNSDDDDDDTNTQVYSNAVVQRRVQDRRDIIIPPELQLETHYDRSLTAAHKYLGDGLHEATGRTVYEEGVVHSLPIIFLKLNLMPGQILPIIARSSDVKLILKYAIFRNRSFGVCYKLNENKRTFGTIAEVYEHSVEIETSQSFQIKAMGHQRFEIVQVTKFPESLEQSLALAKIKIIPDITLTHPYNTLCLHPKKRNTSHGEMCRKRDMWQTQWPDWVYKQFDVNELASRLAKKVKMLYKDIKISDDPCLLSFQVTRLGIFSQEQVSELLGIESTNLRLQYELQYWNKTQSMQKFLCARSGCSAPVCNMSNVFPMSPEGPQGTYCNSWGIIHEMITVTELDDDIDVISVGSPSTECCWFPGYKWTIILCSNCQSHLGWSYLADENLTLTPREFYGLSLRAITSIKDYLVPDRERLEEINDGEMLVTF